MVDNVSTIEELNYVPEMPEKAKNIVIIGAGGIVSGSHLPAYKLASYPVVGIYFKTVTRWCSSINAETNGRIH